MAAAVYNWILNEEAESQFYHLPAKGLQRINKQHRKQAGTHSKRKLLNLTKGTLCTLHASTCEGTLFT